MTALRPLRSVTFSTVLQHGANGESATVAVTPAAVDASKCSGSCAASSSAGSAAFCHLFVVDAYEDPAGESRQAASFVVTASGGKFCGHCLLLWC